MLFSISCFCNGPLCRRSGSRLDLLSKIFVQKIPSSLSSFDQASTIIFMKGEMLTLLTAPNVMEKNRSSRRMKDWPFIIENAGTEQQHSQESAVIDGRSELWPPWPELGQSPSPPPPTLYWGALDPAASVPDLVPCTEKHSAYIQVREANTLTKYNEESPLGASASLDGMLLSLAGTHRCEI